ncbi:unnamed protein product [Ilex paraguariensis]|uniref:BZIP domain-containing protein n=1 Tax=Ilex paraguariensis TaxID=185542 RepID=A0ABC8RR95_9AQUA
MKENMDDGDEDGSHHVIFPKLDSSSNVQASMSMDAFIDDFLKNSGTCTHAHTCNPPGPGADTAHTHTCNHTHTQIFPSENDDVPHHNEHLVPKPRRPSGNREAVRKYREKKKAHTAYLEGEVMKLQFVNQQLIRKLQGRAVLEAEVLRLRGLLMDIGGKIYSELGVFPLQQQCNSTTTIAEGGCGLQSMGGSMSLRCENEIPSFHTSVGTSLQTSTDYQADTHDIPSAEGCTRDSVETLLSSASPSE